MSARYSLRETPRKKELFDGMVETPRRSSRRRSQFPSVEDSEDSSSAAEASIKPRSVRRRTGRFVENISEDEPLEATGSAKANGAVAGTETATKTGAKKQQQQNGHAANGGPKPVDGWVPGQDPKVDYSGEFEFGGSAGTLALMIGFPLLMWYMWIGATYYDGQVPTREPGTSLADFGRHLAGLVYEGAFPSLRAWRIYWTYCIFEAVCYCTLPGIWQMGKPLAHEGGKQLPYFCNAFASFYVTMATMAILHVTGWFPLYTFIDEFGPLLSVAIISGYLCSMVLYVSAKLRGTEHRMTGYFIYDFWMGAELNPRLFNILDLKMFLEVRIPWFILFGLSCGAAARQYEKYGYVSGEVGFLVMAHYLYANACAKGEELIVPTWDMYYEKLGFMLTFWNMAGVPLSYCHCTIYLANHHPDEYSWNKWALGLLYATYLFAYWIWDSCNSQKNRFRAMERGQVVFRKTFPQVPWQTLVNPKLIKTADGETILADGWYGMARKIHYTCDAYFAISWGLICGFKSPFPWFYPAFFCCMIAHRAARDIRRCRNKYGEAWREYERQVPYLFIPYVI